MKCGADNTSFLLVLPTTLRAAYNAYKTPGVTHNAPGASDNAPGGADNVPSGTDNAPNVTDSDALLRGLLDFQGAFNRAERYRECPRVTDNAPHVTDNALLRGPHRFPGSSQQGGATESAPVLPTTPACYRQRSVEMAPSVIGELSTGRAERYQERPHVTDNAPHVTDNALLRGPCR